MKGNSRAALGPAQGLSEAEGMLEFRGAMPVTFRGESTKECFCAVGNV